MNITIPFVLRLASFLSVVTGLMTIIGLTIQAQFPDWMFSLLSLDEALGLVFLGFAVRLSRLENHSPFARVVGKTSRVCLIAIGLSGAAGLHLVTWGTAELQTVSHSGFASGICYALVGVILSLKRSLADRRILTWFTLLCCSYLGACWIAIFLGVAGLIEVPLVLAIGWVPAILITVVCLSFAVLAKAPGLAEILAGSEPSAAAARQIFPLAFIVPLLLAVLRQSAESSGYVHPHAGLLLHVLLSVAFMAGLIAWNSSRLSIAHRVKQSVETAYLDSEEKLMKVVAVVNQPVWILGSDGRVHFSNGAARRYERPATESEPESGTDFALGKRQQQELISAAYFGKPLRTVIAHPKNGSTPVDLDITLLTTINSGDDAQTKVLVIACVGSGPATEHGTGTHAARPVVPVGAGARG